MDTRNTIYNQLFDIMKKLNLSPQSEKYASNDATNFQHLIPENYKEKVLQLEKKKITNGFSEIFSMKMGYGVSLGSFGRNEIAQTAKQIEQRKFGECHTFSQLAADSILNAMENGQINPFQIKILSHKAGLGSHTFIVFFIVASQESENINDLNTFANAFIVDPWACVMGYDERHGIFATSDYPYMGMLKNLTCVYDSNKDPVHQKRIGNKQLAEKLLLEQNKQVPLKKATTNKNSNGESAQVKADEVESFINLLASLVKMENQKVRDLKKYLSLKNLLKMYKNNEATPEIIVSQAINAFFCDPASFKEENGSYTWNKASAAPKMGSDQLTAVVSGIRMSQKVSSLLKLDIADITPSTIINLCKKSNVAPKEISQTNKPAVSITQVSILAKPTVANPNQEDNLIKKQFKEIQKLIASYKNLQTSNESEKAIQHFLTSGKLSDTEKEFYAKYKDAFLKGNLTASKEDNDKVIKALCKKMDNHSDDYQTKIQKILINFQNHLEIFKENDLRKTNLQIEIKKLMKEQPISETSIKDYCKRYLDLDEGKELNHEAELKKLLNEYQLTSQQQHKPKF